MAGPNVGSLSRGFLGLFPIATYTASYQINGGSAISSGATVTDSVTFTGVATTDKVGVAARAAVSVDPNLQLVAVNVTATNTVQLVWFNAGNASITPPGSATWTAVVLQAFNG